MNRRDEIKDAILQVIREERVDPGMVWERVCEAVDRIEALFDEGKIKGVIPIRMPRKSEKPEYESQVMGEVGTERKDALELLQTLARIYPFDHPTPNWCHAVRGTAKWAIGEIERLKLKVVNYLATNERLVSKNEKLIEENERLRAELKMTTPTACGECNFNDENVRLKCEVEELQKKIAALKSKDSEKSEYHPDRYKRTAVCISPEALDRIYARLDALESKDRLIGTGAHNPLEGYSNPFLPTEKKSDGE